MSCCFIILAVSRNLSYTVTEDELEKLFQPFGPVTEINLPIDKLTRYPFKAHNGEPSALGGSTGP